ncbi:MAG: type II secretion system protein [Deltaproteobacteria bacterium]|nr:type II secretion system protein [Deltaproteobacteria bacterium]
MIQCRKGFSLIEMLIVCAIIAVLSLITVPAFLRYTANANLKSAVREVSSDILRQKEQAISRNLEQKIVFNTGSESYTLQEEIAGGGGWTNQQTKLLKSFGSNIDITGTTFGANTITFQTRGTASMGTLTLTNNRGSTATITINITGRTYVAYNMQ